MGRTCNLFFFFLVDSHGAWSVHMFSAFCPCDHYSLIYFQFLFFQALFYPTHPSTTKMIVFLYPFQDLSFLTQSWFPCPPLFSFFQFFALHFPSVLSLSSVGEAEWCPASPQHQELSLRWAHQVSADAASASSCSHQENLPCSSKDEKGCREGVYRFFPFNTVSHLEMVSYTKH